MHADFSRFPPEPPDPAWTRVLFQQGRVALDQDLNAQMAILLAFQRQAVRDLIGAHGAVQGGMGPDAPGFAIAGGLGDPKAGPGRYWVDGWPVRNTAELAFGAQPTPQPEEAEALQKLVQAKQGLVWLEAWERVVTAAEQEVQAMKAPWEPGFLDPALGGVETTLRARLAWRLRLAVGPATPASFQPPRATGRLAARAAEPEEGGETLCALDPEARFAGIENQLYRVEIHVGGGHDAARWKWSRENGSVTLPVRSAAETRVELLRAGRDVRGGVPDEAWVELLDAAALEGVRPGAMAQARRTDGEKPVLALSGYQAPPDFRVGETLVLRRWDHSGAASLPVAGGAAEWTRLEHGVEVRFAKEDADGKPSTFRTGDHWLIPARVLLGDVLWPREAQADGSIVPALLGAHGPRRAAAPLAVWDAAGNAWKDARRLLQPLSP